MIYILFISLFFAVLAGFKLVCSEIKTNKLIKDRQLIIEDLINISNNF